MKRKKRSPTTYAGPWTPAEELRLRELAGTVQVREVARILGKEFGAQRTRYAISCRARLLGISMWWDGYSQNEVAAIFGVWFRTVEKWREEGLLPGEAWEVGRGEYGQWHFTEQALSAFIDHCQWAYDQAEMPPGRWRARAQVAHRADPWLTVQELAELWGCNVRSVRRWTNLGRIPHRRRLAGMGLPKIMVRAADLPGLRRELREAALTNLRAAIALRDERRRNAAA